MPEETPPEPPADRSEETFTLGVEEEYQIVSADTRALRPRAARVLKGAQGELGDEVQNELYLSQIEIATPVCQTLADVRADLLRSRRALIESAKRDSCRIAAAGTHPFSHWDEQTVTPKERYRGLAADFQQIVRELVIFGCHVHIGLNDRELAVPVMNRARVWLAPLLALSANSPFWQGEDTGYASFRTELWSRFPMSGPPQLFQNKAEHDALVRALVETGAISDATKIYWDVRIPERVPTVEFRVTDVCATIDEAVMVAGLVRGLVRVCHEQAVRDAPFPAVRQELLRAAHWRAARFGLTADLIDVAAERAVPAREHVRALLDFVRPGLEAGNDWDEVSALVSEVMARGTGAERQRQAYARAGRIKDVVDFLVQQTEAGTLMDTGEK